ncbi:hypothetical protein F4806DRAFT_465560 [Annulohypoxylon nitens]|nr:hypothetical protein F4806DRAFT_465560 [Annulohypoxylon nitens]
MFFFSLFSVWMCSDFQCSLHLVALCKQQGPGKGYVPRPCLPGRSMGSCLWRPRVVQLTPALSSVWLLSVACNHQGCVSTGVRG